MTIALHLALRIEVLKSEQHICEQRLWGNNALALAWRIEACNIVLERCGHLPCSNGSWQGVIERLDRISYPNGALRARETREVIVHIAVVSKLEPQDSG